MVVVGGRETSILLLLQLTAIKYSSNLLLEAVT